MVAIGSTEAMKDAEWKRNAEDFVSTILSETIERAREEGGRKMREVFERYVNESLDLPSRWHGYKVALRDFKDLIASL